MGMRAFSSLRTRKVLIVCPDGLCIRCRQSDYEQMRKWVEQGKLKRPVHLLEENPVTTGEILGTRRG